MALVSARWLLLWALCFVEVVESLQARWCCCFGGGGRDTSPVPVQQVGAPVDLVGGQPQPPPPQPQPPQPGCLRRLGRCLGFPCCQDPVPPPNGGPIQVPAGQLVNGVAPPIAVAQPVVGQVVGGTGGVHPPLPSHNPVVEEKNRQYFSCPTRCEKQIACIPCQFIFLVKFQ